jgi:hypothetical protein
LTTCGAQPASPAKGVIAAPLPDVRGGLTRGDCRHNDRIEALRAVVCLDRAILVIDLCEDKQVAALLDHDGRVLGRRTVTAEAYALGGLLA